MWTPTCTAVCAGCCESSLRHITMHCPGMDRSRVNMPGSTMHCRGTDRSGVTMPGSGGDVLHRCDGLSVVTSGLFSAEFQLATHWIARENGIMTSRDV